MLAKNRYLPVVVFAILGSLAIGFAYIQSMKETTLRANERERKMIASLKNSPPVAPQTPEPDPISGVEIAYHDVDEDDYDLLFEGVVSDEGVAWLKRHEPVGDLGLLKRNKAYGGYSVGDEVFTYYRIGDDNGHNIYRVMLPCEGMCFEQYQAFFLEREGGYYFLSAHSSPSVGGEGSYEEEYVLGDSVIRNDQILYKTLKPPQEITVAGERLSKSFRELSFPEEITTPQGVKFAYPYAVKTLYGPLVYGYEKEPAYDGSMYHIAVHKLVMPSGFTPLYSSVGMPEITWADGTKNATTYVANGLQQGCGGSFGVAVPNDGVIAENELRQIGTANGNRPVYEVQDPNHPLVQEFFKKLSSRYYTYNEVTKKSELVALTLEQYMNDKGLVLYRDGFGRLVILSSTKYSPAGECGKPVIYLYPESITNIKVRVGADVRISEPNYADGWRVTAQPNGSLEHQGKHYDSLFWEGRGQGEYPNIQGRGFVVPTADIESILNTHLAALGLNEKERGDFMEFWLPKMPTMTYTRLTWLGTNEMDILAPLAVSPRPDTSIRIFLDFEGLSHFVELEPQSLTSVPRSGFTLVEWGGLLTRP